MNNGPVSNLRKYHVNTGNKNVGEFLKAIDSDIYNRKAPFTGAEDVAIKVFYNRIALDELCEALMCNHTQLINRARILQVTSEKESIIAEDVELFCKALKDGVALTDVCEFFNVDIPETSYRFTESDRANAKDAVIKDESQIDLFGDDE